MRGRTVLIHHSPQSLEVTMSVFNKYFRKNEKLTDKLSFGSFTGELRDILVAKSGVASRKLQNENVSP